MREWLREVAYRATTRRVHGQAAARPHLTKARDTPPDLLPLITIGFHTTDVDICVSMARVLLVDY